jgi:hypothetical protein
MMSVADVSHFILHLFVVACGGLYIYIYIFMLAPLSNQWPSPLLLWFIDAAVVYMSILFMSPLSSSLCECMMEEEEEAIDPPPLLLGERDVATDVFSSYTSKGGRRDGRREGQKEIAATNVSPSQY